jgi:hypothetical protein
MLFSNISKIREDIPTIEHQIAEVFRKLLISAFKLEKFDSLVPILANGSTSWKFLKMIFPETIHEGTGEKMSNEAQRMFDIVLKNKQYFINPLEGLVYNVRARPLMRIG